MLFPPSIIFVMTGMIGFTGGMASLNRNLLLALVELAQAHHIPLRVLSYIEDESHRPPFLPSSVVFEPFHHIKRELFKREVALAFTRPLFICDHVSLAFPLLPFVAARWVQTVIYAHGSEAWGHVQRTSRWSFRFAALTLTNSDYTLNHMRADHVKTNGFVCLPGLSPEFPLNTVIPPPSSESIELTAADGKSYLLGSRVLLLVGRISSAERLKGHTELIRVLPALRAAFPDVQLVMPGPGDDRAHLAQLAQTEGVGPAVFLPGYISTELLQRLYHHCYAFVMPSREEGFGSVYLEAMNFGKPCVGCLDDGAIAVIINGETGFLVHDPTDPIELQRVLADLLNSPERAASMGKQGFTRLHQNFTAARLQSRFRQHIERLL